MDNNVENWKRFDIPEKIICVYALMFNGDVIYIGQTINLFQRINSHHIDSKKWNEVRYVICKEEELNDLEYSLIVSLKPRLNGKLNGSYVRGAGSNLRRANGRR